MPSRKYREDEAHSSGDYGNAVWAVRKDTAVALSSDGDYIPLIVDSAGRLYVNSSASIPAGTNPIGGTKDNGPQWTSVYTYTTSADMSTAANITAAPTGGQKLVITDILLSADTAMLMEFKEETSGTVIGAVRIPADGIVQITPRSKWKLPVADKKLQGDSDASGNVYITVFYYSEA